MRHAEFVVYGTKHSRMVSTSGVTKRRIVLCAVIVLAIAFAAAWLSFSGRIAFLTLDRRLKIEVNGVAVEGDILMGRAAAIVTRRDAGKEHSYQLLFEGDIDSTGDMGSVVDCREWVAPHLPLLLETRNYPPCKRLKGEEHAHQRWPLIYRGSSMQFVTKDRSTVSIIMPR